MGRCSFGFPIHFPHLFHYSHKVFLVCQELPADDLDFVTTFVPRTEQEHEPFPLLSGEVECSQVEPHFANFVTVVNSLVSMLSDIA